MRTGSFSRARVYLQRLFDAGQRDAPTMAQLADAQWRDGRAAEARATLASALTADPTNAELLRLKRIMR